MGAGDARSQGISNHDIDYVESNKFRPITLKVNCKLHGCEIISETEEHMARLVNGKSNMADGLDLVIKGINPPPPPPPPPNTHTQWRGALMFPLICAWINVWVNNHEAGDLRCHGAHYDVIVMT